MNTQQLLISFLLSTAKAAVPETKKDNANNADKVYTFGNKTVKFYPFGGDRKVKVVVDKETPMICGVKSNLTEDEQFKLVAFRSKTKAIQSLNFSGQKYSYEVVTKDNVESVNDKAEQVAEFGSDLNGKQMTVFCKFIDNETTNIRNEFSVDDYTTYIYGDRSGVSSLYNYFGLTAFVSLIVVSYF